ncbi:MAG: dethiobiotin synthase [Nevskia sp.]|nr:dethiobiotin synthase [Nevskia sp.]
MATPTIFVTGTDTGVGKTLVARALLLRLRAQGLRAAGFKPVASGARRTPQGLRNEDALALLAASAPGLDYAAVNPYCFEPPIAPHLAAREARQAIRIEALNAAYARLAQAYERVIVEGAGGWRVPLDESLTFAEWVGAHRWPVLLVVGMRLGCLNHALLTAESVLRHTELCGWVANVPPPAPQRLQENIDTLRARLPAPLLGIVPEGSSAEQAAASLTWPESAV